MWLHRRTKKQDDESHKALEVAERHMAQVEARDADVIRVATALRDVRTRNHFREQLEAIMGGSYGEVRR